MYCNAVLCAANQVLQCLLQGVPQGAMQGVLQNMLQGVSQGGAVCFSLVLQFVL